MTKSLPYRPCVGVMLVNAEGLVFVGRRRNKRQPEHVSPGHEWQMPQGGIDPGEQPYAAALRELHEETNVRSTSLIAEAPDWYTYDLPAAVAKKNWRGGYRGQTQRWFALRFTGPDSEIDIHDPGPGHKPEFDAWRWEKIENLADMIIPFKRQVYEQVVSVFAPLIRPA